MVILGYSAFLFTCLFKVLKYDFVADDAFQIFCLSLGKSNVKFSLDIGSLNGSRRNGLVLPMSY